MNYPDGRHFQPGEHIPLSKPAKYRNKKTPYNSVLFDSQKEALRYQELLLLERAGIISNLELQPRYMLVVNGQSIGYYQGDFRYIVLETGVQVVEDVKSPATRTPLYMLKKKLVKAIHGVVITEV